MLNFPRAMLTVSAAAMVAILLLLLPGGWRGLAVLPVFAWLAMWPHLGPHLGKHLEDFWDADPPEPPDHDPFALLETPPELKRLTGPAGPAPDPNMDPRGYWQHRAWDDLEHFPEATSGPGAKSPPVDTSGPGTRPPSLAGPGGHELEGRPFVGCIECGESWEGLEPGEERHRMTCPRVDVILDELEADQEEHHEAALEDQAAEPVNLWPDALDRAAEGALEHTRATFDLLRRMLL